MPQRSVVHATFAIERTYGATPARVFAAFADARAKAAWFRGPDEWERGAYELDFRVGGRERLSGGPTGGTVHTFDCLYHDIVRNERIVYSYDMHLDERHISVSLATVVIEPAGQGTRLVFTEQAAFLDGYDNAGSREHGTGALLDKLGAALDARAI
ncbi:MAG TPA: SRPBCC family protein [Hyphomicrobiaceae bacterium]|jgi:uncharacterized protein YndB with AHSA1/START domain